MATVPGLTDRTPAQRWAEVRDEDALWGDLRPELLAAVQTILEATMEDELTAGVLAGRYERTRERLDHRNGIYRRLLVTELGATELDVPRRRLVPYRPSFLARAARRTTPRRRASCARRSCGACRPARRRRLAERLTGVPRSAAAMSRLGRAARRAGGRVPPPADDVRGPLPPALRRAVGLGPRPGRAGDRRVILAAYGIDAAGRRELLDYRQATAESAAAWGILLLLARRAGARLRGGRPRGRRRGRRDRRRGRRGVPRAELQRCWTHRIRNILEALPLAERRPCLRGLRSIYRARTEAGRRRGLLALGPGLAAPASPVIVRRARARPRRACSPCSRCPSMLRASLRTTNLLERAFRELRRRLRPIGAARRPPVSRPDPLWRVLRLNELLAARPLVAFTQES